jgi:hypothetical protein
LAAGPFYKEVSSFLLGFFDAVPSRFSSRGGLAEATGTESFCRFKYWTDGNFSLIKA